MNSSLTPDDKLSRMLHTFSTTTTEIDECNYQKLNEYNLISDDMCAKMKGMIGFRNIAIHDYKNIDEDILKDVIENHLGEQLLWYENRECTGEPLFTKDYKNRKFIAPDYPTKEECFSEHDDFLSKTDATKEYFDFSSRTCWYCNRRRFICRRCKGDCESIWT